MVSDDWLTLTEAAERLAITPRRARRWIRLGKLPADLRIGPYGLQYFLPAGAIDGVDPTRGGAPASAPPAGASTYAHAVDRYFSERESALIRAVETLRAEIRDANQRQAQWEAALRDELLRSYHELAAAVEAPRRSQPRPPEQADLAGQAVAGPVEAPQPSGSVAPPRPSVAERDASPKLDDGLRLLRETYRRRRRQGWLKLVR